MAKAKKRAKANIPPPPRAGASAEELATYFEKYGMDKLEESGYVRDLTVQEKKDIKALAAHFRARMEARRKARTQLNLAMSTEQLERFTQYANGKHIPPSTLAKAWVLERLDQEVKKLEPASAFEEWQSQADENAYHMLDKKRHN
jgi:hypothetical protein